jgi:hypothetical protein
MADRATEISKSTPAVSQHVMNDARFELKANEPANLAVATLDNSNAVNAMFPHQPAKQNAAYRIMMHDMKMPGYPQIDQADARRFSASEMQTLSKYVAQYKPSADLAKVDAEAKQLAKLGFPHPILETDDTAKALLPRAW